MAMITSDNACLLLWEKATVSDIMTWQALLWHTLLIFRATSFGESPCPFRLLPLTAQVMLSLEDAHDPPSFISINCLTAAGLLEANVLDNKIKGDLVMSRLYHIAMTTFWRAINKNFWTA